MKNNQAQVWIETVLYTVVILAIIAIVLSFTIPKINEGKDKLVIEQSITALKNLDRSIYDAARQTGNIRIVEFSLKRGNLHFYPNRGNITLTIGGLTSIYSEDGQVVYDGEVEMISTSGAKSNSINLTISYPANLPIQYKGKNDYVKINPSSLPYRFSIENTGTSINIKEV